MKLVIRKFITETLSRNGDFRDFNDEESLVKSQRLDSLDLMDLLLFIEENFNIPASAIGEDMLMLDSLNDFILYIEKNSDFRA